MKSVIDILDLSVEEIDELIVTAKDIMKNPENYQEKCKNKQLATLFYEPSTRTRLSFESAMQSLGGSVIGFSSVDSSSVSKGETVGDTAKIVSQYVDILVMRHFKEGAPMVASLNSKVPVINAGDGGHSHPTQTLTDLLTISTLKGRLNNFSIGLCGDLKFGRTVHSLISALSRHTGIKFYLIAPEELKLPEYVKTDVLDKNNLEYEETTDLENTLPKLDVLYMTRIQRERFYNVEEYFRLKDSYILDCDKLKNAKQDLIILHPLPRVNEIAVEVDNDPRAAYFTQALCGKYIRMALIMKLLQLNDKKPFVLPYKTVDNLRCNNTRCITSVESDLKHIFKITEDGIKRCVYCESEYNS